MSEAIENQEVVTPTEYEQSMIDKVDEARAKAEGQADPDKAPEYQEEVKEPEIDYKAEYEKLKAAQETPEVAKDTKNLEVTQDVKEPPKDSDTNNEVTKSDGKGLLTPEQMGKYTQEFNTDGSLSEGSYAELEKLGITKEVVDTYIQGQAAIQEAQANKVYKTVGGADAYSDMISWAKDNWTPEQINVFNSQVNSGDESQIMFGVEALATQFKAAKGSPIPKRTLSGSTQGTSGNTNSFETKADMYKAMNNSLYGKDASYTNMVAAKIANSSF